MAMAHVAPMDHYTRMFYIADHAVERFRERLQETDVKYRDDNDLRNIIDSTVKEAIHLGRIEGVSDDGVSTAIVDLSQCHMGDGLYAVIKANSRAGACEYAVVTLLQAHHVEVSKRRGRWTDDDTLAKRLMAECGVTIPSRPTTLALAKLGDKVAEEVAAIRSQLPPPKSLETVLVTYRVRDGQSVMEEYVKSEAPQRIEQLINGGTAVASTVCVWRRLVTTMKVSLGD